MKTNRLLYRIIAIAAVMTSLSIDACAQAIQPNPTSALKGALAAYRASPLFALGKVRLQDVNLVDKTPVEILEWLNRQTISAAVSNAPRIRIEVRPLELTVPSYPEEVELVITGQVTRLRWADEEWRDTIASNSMRRVTVTGRNMTALEILKDCCTKADLQYADDGRDIVIGNVYFLRWPPKIACRVFPISEKLVKELGDGIKDIIAPASFHDNRRDWITLIPERNAVVIFHHPELMDSFASSIRFANENAEELILRRRPPPPLGGKK